MTLRRNQPEGRLRVDAASPFMRHVIVPLVASYRARYPQVQLSILPASPSALDKMVLEGEADFAIGTELVQEHEALRKLSCYAWNRSVVVPEGHALLDLARPLQLADIVAWPLVTYEFAFQKEARIARAFAQAQLEPPKVVLASADTDIIKTYVRLGLGIGLMASMAYDAQADEGLRLISAEHLFEPSFSHIVLRQDAYLRGYAYAFLQLFSERLTREYIEAALYAPLAEDFSI